MQHFCTCENSPASRTWLMWSETSRSVGGKKERRHRKDREKAWEDGAIPLEENVPESYV